jgi:hypothetical protein
MAPPKVPVHAPSLSLETLEDGFNVHLEAFRRVAAKIRFGGY